MLFKSSTASSAAVLDMLREDHAKVKALFDEFEQARDSRTKARIVETVLIELEVHAKLEEGLIYPALREKIDDDDLMDEAMEEHHLVHVLINELKRMKPDDDRYDAKFTVLGESVKHHIKEEEEEMFPKAEESNTDWHDLEDQAVKRREQLMARLSPSAKNGKRRATGRKKR